MRVRFNVVEASPGPTPAPPALPGDWHLAFHDEFSGPTVAANVWADKFWWGGNVYDNSDELEAYDRSAVSTSNGALNITARKQNTAGTDARTYPYASGLLTTGGVDGQAAAGFTFTHGYAEARIKIPKGQGLWPAFWMLPASRHDGNGEIDIMEVIGSDPVTHEMHYHVHGNHEGKAWHSGIDLSQDYHVYAVDWQADHIAFYVDGIERWRYADAASIVNEPMYLMLNLAVGGQWPGAPDATTQFPATMSVDYVRVWQNT
jgi:beta-glucanase (GH16 family)